MTSSSDTFLNEHAMCLFSKNQFIYDDLKLGEFLNVFKHKPQAKTLEI